jgi:hypothetical protein
MLLGFFTVVFMLIIAYVFFLEGVFTAFFMTFNIFFAGLVAFNFFEPLADLLEPPLAGTFLGGFEDAFCLTAIFCLTLGLLRLITNSINHTRILLPAALQSGGAVLFGLVAGYLLSGFLLCTFQTLPWHQNFLSFNPTFEPGPEHLFRRVMPPDRVWLALMYRAGACAFSSDEDDNPKSSATTRYKTFDKYGTFELRYARYRRYNSEGVVRPYQGELDDEVFRNSQ